MIIIIYILISIGYHKLRLAWNCHSFAMRLCSSLLMLPVIPFTYHSLSNTTNVFSFSWLSKVHNFCLLLDREKIPLNCMLIPLNLIGCTLTLRPPPITSRCSNKLCEFLSYSIVDNFIAAAIITILSVWQYPCYHTVVNLVASLLLGWCCFCSITSVRRCWSM